MPTYFCFIESDILRIPHMEPLSAETDDEAFAQARALLRNHASGIAIETDPRTGLVTYLSPVRVGGSLAQAEPEF